MECLELSYRIPRRVPRRVRTKTVVLIEEIGNELLTQDLWRYDLKSSFAYRSHINGYETKVPYSGEFDWD